MVELVNERLFAGWDGRKNFHGDLICGSNVIGEINGSCKREYQNGGYVFLDEMEYTYNISGHYNSDLYPTIAAAKHAFEKEWTELGRPIPEQEKKGKSKINVKLLAGETNRDFHPTPSKLAGMMFAGIDFKNVRTVLEPSAGKGDLIEYLKNLRKVRDNRLDIDCIELDNNLQYILTGKEYKVVFDDFLSFHSGKKYDLILMNPPFSEGDKHLLKALQLQRNGGQICCLLNAETLRNPYTNERKALHELLRKNYAKVKYVQNGFSKAERQTDVEIAIVWVNVPVSYGTSNIYEGLKRAEKIKREQQGEVTDVVSADTVQGMIERYNTEVKLCEEFIREYEALKPYILTSLEDTSYNSPIIELTLGRSASFDVNDCIECLRSKYWHELMNNEELTSLFTDTLRSKYSDIVNDMSDYDFNEFNIRKVIARMNADIVGGLQEEIFKIFEKLSEKHSWYPECDGNIHYFNGWKTNKAHKVGMKVIVPTYGVFSDSKWSSDTFKVYEAYNTISDIEKVFNYLDGNMTASVDTFRMLDIANRNGITRNIQCKYFSVTFYKKGTVHIKMHPETERIIDALNIYVCKGKNWLPPSYGKAAYDDMTAEEQAVIDDFQGREKYEKVMQNPSLYLYNEQDMGRMLMLEAH